MQAISTLIRSGRLDEADSRLESLQSEDGGNPTYPYMRAVVARVRGEIDAAIAHLEQALGIDADNLPALQMLGQCYGLQKKYDRAAEAYRQVAARHTDPADAWSELGRAYFESEDMIAAVEAYEEALAGGNRDAGVLWRMAVALNRTARPERALTYLEEAVERAPEDPSVLMAYGDTLSGLKKHDEAIDVFRRIVERHPKVTHALSNAARALRDSGRFSAAAQLMKRAIKLKPDDPDLRSRYGLLLQNLGRIDDALAEYEFLRACFDPSKVGRNFLLTMHYSPRYSPARIAQDHRAWGEAFMAKLAPPTPRHDNDPDPERRLRVGYLSGDYWRHSVSFFLEPILAAHDRDAVEVHALSTTERTDKVTDRLRGLADRWHALSGMPDDRAETLIKAEGIDILVDLSGHTNGERHKLLARKPAPIQIGYLGYPDSTGLPTIDYRLTDAYADPPGLTEAYHVEDLVRLPDCFLCYRPSAARPPLSPPPCLDRGAITFGSFNNLAKISDPAIAAWVALLDRVPNSRLVLKAIALADEGARTHLAGRLAAAGAPMDRIVVRKPVNDDTDHLRAYAEVDIALDTFPYTGTTTTLEALSMGAPVVSLAGEAHVRRVGGSILNAIGLPGLIAEDVAAYIDIAAALAGDRERLSELRNSLRDRLEASPLRDEAGFAGKLEQAYRRMWRRWCAERTS